MNNKFLTSILAAMLLCLTGISTANDESIRQALALYQQALTRQDEPALERMISADAPVKIILSQPGGAALTLTLTRDEYLQHLHALWKFSSKLDTRQSGLTWQANGRGYRVTLDQHETLQLFGEHLEQISKVELSLVRVETGMRISEITSYTEGW